MATKSLNRKTTTAKATDNKTVTKEGEAVETKSAVSSSAIEEKPVKKFYDQDGVMCRSCTSGQLIMVGKKTGNLYTWSNFGDMSEVEFSDLRAAKLTKSDFVWKPLFIIEDEDLLEQWNDVAEMYKNMYTPEDLEEIFSINNLGRFGDVLKQLPVGIQDSVKTMAADKIADGSLDSINKIKKIDEVLGTDLMLIAMEE